MKTDSINCTKFSRAQGGRSEFRRTFNRIKSLLTLSLLLILLSVDPSTLNGQVTSAAQTWPENPSLEFKIGQMLMIGFRGMDVDESSHIARDISEHHLGAVVLFDYDVPTRQAIRNIESPAQLRSLVADLKSLSDVSLLVAVDQEGGRVARLKEAYGFPATLSAGSLGRIDQIDTTRNRASIMAEALSRAGINANLAPVVDLNVNPDNPIIGGIDRSFSSESSKVVEHADAFINAHHSRGVLTALKHFPGHGSSDQDSHLGLTDVTNSWTPEELDPFRQLISSGKVDMVMTAHVFNENWDTEHPATLSSSVIRNILREDLGFQGVVVSDDMQMEAIRSYYGLETAVELALKAGIDILCFANNSVYDEQIVPRVVSIIKKLIQDGTITAERIDDSYNRIRSLKSQL